MLEKIVITSLCITLIHVSMMEGMVLFKLRQRMDPFFPYWIQKPLYECLPCMCSYWGTILYFWFTGEYNLQGFIVFVLAVGGVNTIISVFINRNIVEKEPLPADLVRDVDSILFQKAYEPLDEKDKIIEQLYEHCRKL